MKIKYSGNAWVTIAMLVAWLMGIVIARGFWSVAFAIFFPPWAWYLLVERVMHIAGLVP